MKDKLKIKIWNYKNVVLYEVLEQDESLRDYDFPYMARNGWTIISDDFPELNEDDKQIFVRGQTEEDDKNVFCDDVYSIEEAEKIVKEVQQAVKEFNENFNSILDDKEKEYLKAVIKPFRNEINFIRKVDFHNDKEYIKIEFIGDNMLGEVMDFKSFKKGTMYKGMKVDKRYTLEELGLQKEIK